MYEADADVTKQKISTGQKKSYTLQHDREKYHALHGAEHTRGLKELERFCSVLHALYCLLLAFLCRVFSLLELCCYSFDSLCHLCSHACLFLLHIYLQFNRIVEFQTVLSLPWMQIIPSPTV